MNGNISLNIYEVFTQLNKVTVKGTKTKLENNLWSRNVLFLRNNGILSFRWRFWKRNATVNSFGAAKSYARNANVNGNITHVNKKKYAWHKIQQALETYS